ncbi:hypothetical protein PVAP13_2NG537003 [Panicum virgatum]|uniref:Uncharacterized protein n=1 Tax=Panicum virgatum TaxID=38727 RepID=A0A8T0VLT4_PANVG|nr:hypothetical protein PVAP13_2NG537003 [Panicum virgatum]
MGWAIPPTCSTSYFHSSVCRSAGTRVQTQAWIISNKERLPFEKDLHGGARSDPVQSSNEKVKVSTCVKLMLFCIYNMLC